MFPRIEFLSDLVPFIEANPQFRIQEQNNGTTVICYMLQDEDTFKGENEEHAKECRGITFDTATGQIISRTLHKFENVGQSDRAQPDQIPWDRIVRVMDKRDGSMITPVLIDGKIVCKTKKTFTSNEAVAATELLNSDPEKVEWCRRQLEQGFTPTFEWTSPRFPIVLTYPKDELTLLQIRHNISGHYVMWQAFLFSDQPDAGSCPFPIVENLIDHFSSSGLVMWDYFVHAQLDRTGVEGWIVQTSDGEMWKVKTKWYCDLHHSVTFTRWRDVARTVLDDKADDLKAAFAMTGRSIEPIIQVERAIHGVLVEMEKTVRMIVESGAGLDAKGMALRFQGHEFFGQIMSTFRGKTINYRDLYLKNRIREWGLDVIPTAVSNEDVEIITSNESEAV